MPAPTATISSLRPLTILPLPKGSRWLAIRGHGEHWCSPVVGDSAAAIPATTYCLLVHTGRTWLAILPGVADGVQGVLTGHARGVAVATRHRDPGSADRVIVAQARASDPYAALEAAARALAEHCGGFRLRVDKPLPAWIDWFGWCTWDSFYRKVSAANVAAGFRAFRKAGLVPPMFILDDGWQDTDPALAEWGGMLCSLDSQPNRFPKGLAVTVAAARDAGARCVGVWHALEGYWEGIKPGTDIAARYGVVAVPHGAPRRPSTDPVPNGALPPAQASAFFNDYHRQIAAAGVDMVKVDNQGSLSRHLQGVAAPVAGMRTYQEALQGSIAVHFAGEQLHCMAMDSLNYYHLSCANITRNSEDYGPRADDGHQRHLVSNAYNAVWTQLVAMPDWDMFWSSGTFGAYHAAARAICGGPVYVSDEPGRFDEAVLRKLVVTDGLVLRPDTPALPPAEMLVRDPLTEEVPLIFASRCAEVGSVGVFHANPHTDAALTWKVSVSDVAGLAAGPAMVWLHNRAEVVRLGKSGSTPVSVGSKSFEIATVSTIRSGVATFGSLDHFHSAGHLAEHLVDGYQHQLTLRDGGRIGLWCARAPRSVSVDGRALAAKHRRFDPATGLLELTLPTGGMRKVLLTLS